MKGRRPAGVRVGGLVVSTVRQPVAAELVPVEPTAAELVPAEWVPVVLPRGRFLRTRRAAIVAGGLGLGSGMFAASSAGHPVAVGLAAGAAMAWVVVGDVRHRRRPLREVVSSGWVPDHDEDDEVELTVEEERELDRRAEELGAALLARAHEALARRDAAAAGDGGAR